ncbi:MAG: nuclear transport factor 2 family protein [Colwellia sp.]|nr:nuclear transport factor 2 family protein [Colwellia sp.]MCW8865109.1 nuclear transport factor 2 family protein [Colwellia sp.]MCW9082921.1 nuclear transport factor 2 family protein [Colwellia sp.]
MNKLIVILLVMLSFSSWAQKNSEEQAIKEVLNSFHQAAADAKAKPYLSLLTEDAIFLGTDASERWNKKQFTDFVLPYFKQGKGWLYVVEDRHISLLKNDTIAFFDEILINKNYGRCRGSGVLVKTAQGWKISQFNLTVLVPNGVSAQVIEKIKAYEQTQ